VTLICGLRRGEALGISWADIDFDFDSGLLHVRRQVRREGLLLEEAQQGGDEPARPAQPEDQAKSRWAPTNTSIA
jgi:integrase